MARENLENTLIVVIDPLGNEAEVCPDGLIGNLDEETSQSLIIGRAVRSALMVSEGDAVTVEVSIYYQ